MQARKRKLPQISGSCKFEGVNLKRHLKSIYHNLLEKESALAKSFMNQKIKHIFLANKHGIPKPAICQECHTSNSRIEVHIIHTHQITCGSEKFQEEMKKCRKYIKIHAQNFCSIVALSNTGRDGDNDDADHDENISAPKKIFNLRTKEVNKPTKIINTEKGKKRQMPKSSATRICLRGANPTIALLSMRKIPH